MYAVVVDDVDDDGKLACIRTVRYLDNASDLDKAIKYLCKKWMDGWIRAVEAVPLCAIMSRLE